ncbi:unnamed protein product [Enterobius vermicularis]|uniref:Uncharacterized protein n=1 Tax=Enterobius vermicularis TaxID=51028 RepID=A0A0N4VED4_ENTVE|nr:unnamed protein product [Enterobius vermicularis]
MAVSPKNTIFGRDIRHLLGGPGSISKFPRQPLRSRPVPLFFYNTEPMRPPFPINPTGRLALFRSSRAQKVKKYSCSSLKEHSRRSMSRIRYPTRHNYRGMFNRASRSAPHATLLNGVILRTTKPGLLRLNGFMGILYTGSLKSANRFGVGNRMFPRPYNMATQEAATPFSQPYYTGRTSPYKSPYYNTFNSPSRIPDLLLNPPYQSPLLYRYLPMQRSLYDLLPYSQPINSPFMGNDYNFPSRFQNSYGLLQPSPFNAGFLHNKFMQQSGFGYPNKFGASPFGYR